MGALNLPGGLIPTLGSVVQTYAAAENLVSSFSPRQGEGQALTQLKQRQQLQQQQATQNAALERERIATQSAQDEDRRRTSLRRAVARQRASFGASGVAQGAGGSSDAVLLGFFDETETELSRRQELDNLRNRALDQNLGQRRSLNVLQATQLKERQNLGRFFTFS